MTTIFVKRKEPEEVVLGEMLVYLRRTGRKRPAGKRLLQQKFIGIELS